MKNKNLRGNVKCDQQGCGTRIARKQDMARHLDERHRDPKKCARCDYTTRRKSRLVAHTTKRHPKSFQSLDLIDSEFSLMCS